MGLQVSTNGELMRSPAKLPFSTTKVARLAYRYFDCGKMNSKRLERMLGHYKEYQTADTAKKREIFALAEAESIRLLDSYSPLSYGNVQGWKQNLVKITLVRTSLENASIDSTQGVISDAPQTANKKFDEQTMSKDTKKVVKKIMKLSAKKDRAQNKFYVLLAKQRTFMQTLAALEPMVSTSFFLGLKPVVTLVAIVDLTFVAMALMGGSHLGVMVPGMIFANIIGAGYYLASRKCKPFINEIGGKLHSIFTDAIKTQAPKSGGSDN